MRGPVQDWPGQCTEIDTRWFDICHSTELISRAGQRESGTDCSPSRSFPRKDRSLTGGLPEPYEEIGAGAFFPNPQLARTLALTVMTGQFSCLGNHAETEAKWSCTLPAVEIEAHESHAAQVFRGIPKKSLRSSDFELLDGMRPSTARVPRRHRCSYFNTRGRGHSHCSARQ